MKLRRMGRGDLTTHGFRSTFGTGPPSAPRYPREVAEMALAHRIGDKVEAAYRRGDLLAKRTRAHAGLVTLLHQLKRKEIRPAGPARGVRSLMRSASRLARRRLRRS